MNLLFYFNFNLYYLGSFITIATEKFKELCTLFESTDRSVNSIKRYLGETVLGCGSSTTSSNSSSNNNNTPEEDSWQTFFQLLVKFAETYKLGILELEDWKKAEQRLQQKSNNTISTQMAINQFQKENLKQVTKNSKHTHSPKNQNHKQNQNNNNNNSNTGKDVMEVFKERMQIIRKRNSTNFDDSDLSDNEQTEW